MRRLGSTASLLCIGLAVCLLLQGAALAQEATPRTGGYNIHIFPAVTNAPAPPPDAGPLVYNGGPVMAGGVTTYAIFWVPSGTSMTSLYQTVQKRMLGDYAGHGIGNNNTQYYQIVGTTKTYIHNSGKLGGSFVDTKAYPASGCTDSVTPSHCLTDAQIVSEIAADMTANGWTGGLGKMFFLFTPSGVGSCFDSTSSSCAYTQYCAYHSYFVSGTTPVIYGNEPYGDPNYCQVPGTPAPSGDAAADTATTAASHELTEATTDPELNAWYTALGNEIGDLCAYIYGSNTWDSAKANQMWNGHFYELQEEWDNHKSGCYQIGP